MNRGRTKPFQGLEVFFGPVPLVRSKPILGKPLVELLHETIACHFANHRSGGCTSDKGIGIHHSQHRHREVQGNPAVQDDEVWRWGELRDSAPPGKSRRQASRVASMIPYCSISSTSAIPTPTATAVAIMAS